MQDRWRNGSRRRCLHLNYLQQALARTDATAIHTGWGQQKWITMSTRIVGSFCVTSKVSFGFVCKYCRNQLIHVLCLLVCPLLVRMEMKYTSSFWHIPFHSGSRIIWEGLSKSWVTKSTMKFWVAVLEAVSCFPLFCIALIHKGCEDPATVCTTAYANTSCYKTCSGIAGLILFSPKGRNNKVRMWDQFE